MTQVPAGVEAYWMGGRLITVKYVSGDPDKPSYTESVLRAGQGPAMTVHRYADFDHYILDGVLTFSIGGTVCPVAPGDVVHVGRGVHSTYVVGDQGARILTITTPGHPWVNYVRALGTPAAELTLPPASFVPLPMEIVHRLAKANGLEFVGDRLPGASREGH